MKKIILSIIYLFIFVINSFSQNIEGSVKNKEGDGIPFAKIIVLNSDKFIYTEKNGNFRLNIENGNYELSTSAVGYATVVKTVTVKANGTTSLDILLEDNAQSLSEIVVSSDKSETQLQKTPMAITSLSPKAIREYRIWNINDLSALAPSLYTVEHGNSTSANFFNIRGTLGFTNEQSVATYIDGVYQFEFFSAPLNFNNIERIEILRGPQGTLYGRNAFGGVVNVFTKKPSFNTSVSAEIDYGNYDQQKYNLNFSAPVVKNKLLLGVSALYSSRNGIYSNPTLSTNNFDKRKAVNANFDLGYFISDNWTLNLNVKTESNNDAGAYPWVLSDSIARNNKYIAYGNWNNTEKRSNTNVSGVLKYFGRNYNFTSITSFIDYHLYYPDRYDLDYTSDKFFSGNGDYKQNQFTQEFRLSSSSNITKLLWNTGAFLFTGKNTSESNTFYEEGFQIIDPNAPYTIITDGNRKDKGIAFFGQATYSVTPLFQITAGARYDIEEKEITSSSSFDSSGVISVFSPEQTDSKTFNAFTPKLVLNYFLSNNSMIYASYSKGFRVGGFNLSALTEINRTYDPEYSDNFEVASKNSLLDNRLKLNLTAFYLQQRDQQVTTSTNGLDYVTLNVGDMNNLGLELEMAAIPVKNLQLEWNASLSDADYSSLPLYDFATGTIIDYSGNKPIYNPDVASMLAAQYNYPISGNNFFTSAFLRVEYKYIGKYYFDFQNTEYQPGYGLVNLRTGIETNYGDLAFWVRNLNDAEFIAWGTFGSYMLGSPRMFGATLSFRY